MSGETVNTASTADTSGWNALRHFRELIEEGLPHTARGIVFDTAERLMRLSALNPCELSVSEFDSVYERVPILEAALREMYAFVLDGSTETHKRVRDAIERAAENTEDDEVWRAIFAKVMAG